MNIPHLSEKYNSITLHLISRNLFIDLNSFTPKNDYSDIIGDIYKTSVFYFHSGELSKMYLDCPFRLDIHILSKQESINVLEMSKADSKVEEVLSKLTPETIQNPPEIVTLLISFEHDFFVYLFKTQGQYMTDEGLVYENVSRAQVNDQVQLGISNDSYELCTIFVKNPFGNFIFEKAHFTEEILGDDLFLKLKTLVKRSIEFSDSVDELENRIKQLKKEGRGIPKWNSMLERLLTSYQAEKSIF